MKRFFKASACTLVLSLFITFGLSQNSISYAQTYNAGSNTTKVVENVTNSNIKVLIYKNVNLSQCKSTKDVVKTLRNNGYTNINMKNVKKIKGLKNILAAIKSNATTANQAVTKTTTKTPSAATTPTPTKTPTVTKAPTTTTPSAGTASNTTNMSSYAKEVLRLVNIERSKAGLTPYTTTSALTSAANKRAQETKQSFSHTRPNGTGFQTVLGEYGISYRAAGENIAYGQKTPQEVVTGWMNSPGHRANILNANFNKIGIGVYQSNGVYYWTQEFTN